MSDYNFGMKYRIIIEKIDGEGNKKIVGDSGFKSTNQKPLYDFFMELLDSQIIKLNCNIGGFL